MTARQAISGALSRKVLAFVVAFTLLVFGVALGFAPQETAYADGETYSITVADAEHGGVIVSAASAAEGEAVSVSTVPEIGYKVAEGSLTATYVDSEGAVQTLAMTKGTVDLSYENITAPAVVHANAGNGDNGDGEVAYEVTPALALNYLKDGQWAAGSIETVEQSVAADLAGGDAGYTMIWGSDKDKGGNVHFNGIDEVTIVYPAEVAPECGFIVSIDGAAVPAEDITIDESGYDASYEDYFTGDVVECIIPLATVKVPFGVESVEITLDDSYDAYQSYIYTAEPGDSGYTECVDMGFGENAEVGAMETVLAYADTAYPTDVLPVSQVYRIQTAYDPETWASDNLYAIAFAPTAAPGWHKDASGEWYCFDADGDLITDGWAKDSKGWMWMASNGKITKSKWVKDGGSWYYLKSNGYMATGTLTINGKAYRFASNGKWIS